MSRTVQHERLIAYSIMLIFLVLTIVLPFTLTRDTSGYIQIESDKDFKKYKFTGEGTEDSPFLIENIEVIESMKRGISIEHTTQYFVIRNCYLVGNFFNGIRINNIAAGTAIIYNNTCVSHSLEGIKIVSSDGIEVYNNTCYNNKLGITILESNNCNVSYNMISRYLLADDREGHADRGIVISNSESVNVIGNEIKKASGGIEIDLSDRCLVSSNIVKNSYQFSISLFDSFDCEITNSVFRTSIRIGISLFDSNGNSINGCTIQQNGIGINFKNSSSNQIVSNTITKNVRGAYIYSNSNSNLIVFNEISNSTDEGIDIDDGNLNVIHHNSFYFNNKAEIAQVMDNGFENRWYDDVALAGNYWYGWNASLIYDILGDANSTDPYPLENPAILTYLFLENKIQVPFTFLRVEICSKEL